MWLVLLACAGEVRDFADQRALAICAWHVRCDTLRAAGFADQAECEAALGDAVATQARTGELGCDTFDAPAADACLAAWETASCDEAVDLSACDAVCPTAQ
jgi:hypothetical protein